MAEIDDELLALAGGDSDDEGSPVPSRHSSASPPSRLRDDARKSSDKRRSRSSARRDESEEEGEASSRASSPDSQQSAPMDESDSEAEQPSRARAAPAEGDDDKYPIDGMFTSRAEKAEIMGMREVDREQILAERVSEVERQRQNRLLRQMVNTADNEERKQVRKKRSADTAELEEDDRKTSRTKTSKAGETAMDSLRRAREEKQRRKEGYERRRDDYSPRHGSPDSVGQDSDFERPRSRSPAGEPTRDLPPAELRDYERVRLGRNEFAQVCSTPGFETAISGCFIRIALGPHPDTGVEQYRMAAIKGFVSGRPYALAGPNGTFVTDQYCKAAHGKSVKEFPFIAASSGKFTEGELNRFQVTCQNEGVTLPTSSFLSNKVDDINNLINHKWTSEEIKARLNKKNEMRRKFDPAERERVARLLEEAREAGKEERAEKLQEELDSLSTQRLAFRTSLGPSKTGETTMKTTEQDKLAERNRENRRMNAELVRKAQLKEKAKVREIEEAIKRGELVQEDSSRRLRTKAKFHHDVNEKTGEAAAPSSTPPVAGNGTGKGTPTKAVTSAALAKLQEQRYLAAKGVPTIHKPVEDDEIIGSLDLGIDIDI